MFRFAFLLLVGMSLFDGAYAGVIEQLRSDQRDMAAKAGKLPPVRLNEKQTASLRESWERGRISWLGAGRQKDGKIFVCYILSGRDNFGRNTLLIFAGTFAADGGSYQRSGSYIWSQKAVIQECNDHGFDPPVVSIRR